MQIRTNHVLIIGAKKKKMFTFPNGRNARLNYRQ